MSDGDSSLVQQQQPQISSDDGRVKDRPNMDLLLDEWQLAKQGIVMWLNNEPEQAESFLKAHIQKTHVMTSYTFISVIVSLV